jgi:hypothetical protein
MWVSGLRRLHQFFWQVGPTVLSYLAFAASFLRGRRHTLRMWPEGPVKLGPSVALFCHFDRRQQLAEHLISYLRELHSLGFSVVFITNSGHLSQESLTALQPLCSAVMLRRNVGYDFGAICEALDRLELPRLETEQLLIANDSVYGPMAPITDLMARVNFNEADLWGATDSWQHRYHLQSYFLVAGRRAITSTAWEKFWRGVRQVSSKRWVIVRYEIGLTQALLSVGLRCRALWPYHEILGQTAAGVPSCGGDAEASDPVTQMRLKAHRHIRDAAAKGMALNPTAELWRHLLLAGFPFLKVEMLRKNPAQIADIVDWRTVVSDLPDGDVAAIERDLQTRQSRRHRAP